MQLVHHMTESGKVRQLIKLSEQNFVRENRVRERKAHDLIPESELDAILKILTITPTNVGVIDAADNWVTDALKDAARAPSANEWERLLKSPLDGQIGISPALHWRFNFGRLFNDKGLHQSPVDDD